MNGSEEAGTATEVETRASERSHACSPSCRSADRYRRSFSGEKAFKLYDTFGLPRDFIEDAAATRNQL